MAHWRECILQVLTRLVIFVHLAVPDLVMLDCRQATLIHGPDATLVGTDALGNK